MSQSIEQPRQRVNANQERRLWDKYWNAQDRDNVSRRLVELYLPLVVSIVERLSIRVRHQVEANELLSAGVIGLHDAIHKYSKGREATFSTFAKKRVHGAIIDELRKQDHLTRTQRQHYRKICAMIRELTETLTRAPTMEEIAKEMGMKPDEVRSHIALGNNSISLNQQLQSGTEMIDTIEDGKALSPADAAHQTLAKEDMRAAYHGLALREKKLLYLRHYEGMRTREIAKILEISESRVSQIYKEIIIKLRALMKIQPV